MKLRFTTISSDEVGSALGRAGTDLESFLNPIFEGRDFGGSLDQFSVIAVAVYSNPEENKGFQRKPGKNRFKRWPTGEAVVNFTVFPLFNPDEIARMSQEQIRAALCNSLLVHLADMSIKMPKGFERERMASEIKRALLEDSSNQSAANR